MATRSVREHPGRFLVSILEGFMDKLLSEKTTGAMQACWWDQDCIYLIISQKEGPAPTPPCYLTLLNFLLSGLEINKAACSVSWDLVIMGLSTSLWLWEEKWWCHWKEGVKDVPASRSIFGCLQRHIRHKRIFSKSSALGCAFFPRSHILALCLPFLLHAYSTFRYFYDLTSALLL